MLVPLIVLSIGAIAAGFVFADYFVGEAPGRVLARRHLRRPIRQPGARGAARSKADVGETGRRWWCSRLAACLGRGLHLHVSGRRPGRKLAARGGPLYVFFYNKWFFDELYQATFVRAAKFLGDLFWKGGDQKLIDGLGPDGVGAVLRVGRGTGKAQTGYLYHYAFVMLLGVVGLLSYAIFRGIH
jgi:NADH-quinone oxidoreductase subunit L